MEPLLKLESLSKAFGGLRVTNNVNMSVMPGEISAIIGPNGAGKTTLFNQITGNLLPDTGKVLFQGKDLVGQTTQKIVFAGIGRAFQISSLFPDETVLDNIKVAVMSRMDNTKKLWKEFDLTLIFIEHDMDMVFDVAQVVRVLQQGTLLAEGSPEEIQNNKEVITAYLGEEL